MPLRLLPSPFAFIPDRWMVYFAGRGTKTEEGCKYEHHAPIFLSDFVHLRGSPYVAPKALRSRKRVLFMTWKARPMLKGEGRERDNCLIRRVPGMHALLRLCCFHCSAGQSRWLGQQVTRKLSLHLFVLQNSTSRVFLPTLLPFPLCHLTSVQ